MCLDDDCVALVLVGCDGCGSLLLLCCFVFCVVDLMLCWCWSIDAEYLTMISDLLTTCQGRLGIDLSDLSVNFGCF